MKGTEIDVRELKTRAYVEAFPNCINFNVNVNSRHREILLISLSFSFLFFAAHVCSFFKSVDDKIRKKNELACELLSTC